MKKKSKPKQVKEEIKPFLKWNPKFKYFYVDIDTVSKYLIKTYKFKTIYGKRNEVVWVYQNGIWINEGTALIKVQTENLLESYAKNNVVNEVLGKIKRLTEYAEEDFEKTDLYKIPVLNGVYNIKTDKLEEHSPDNNFRFVIPINYIPGSACPKLQKFLSEVLYEKDI